MGYVLVAIGVVLASVGCGSLNPLPSPSGGGIEAVTVVDGYHFGIKILNDPAFGPHASTPATFSTVAGVGFHCEWRREGPTVATATEVWGPTGAVVSTGARYSPLRSGATGARESGLPASAVIAASVTLICGLRDDSGDHGVIASFQLRKAGSSYTGERLSLAPWRG
jgi:hypothetical protein